VTDVGWALRKGAARARDRIRTVPKARPSLSWPGPHDLDRSRPYGPAARAPRSRDELSLRLGLCESKGTSPGLRVWQLREGRGNVAQQAARARFQAVIIGSQRALLHGSLAQSGRVARDVRATTVGQGGDGTIHVYRRGHIRRGRIVVGVSLEHRSPALRAELSTSEIRAEPLWRPLFFQGQTRWPLNCLQLAGCALQSIRLWNSGIAIRGGTSACGPGLRRLDVRAVVRTSMSRGLVPATASSRNFASHYDLALLLPTYHLLSFDSLSAPVQPDYHGLATTDAMALTELQPTLMHLGLLLFTTPMHLGKTPRNPPARRPPPGECG
jgi:hypothetical protein